MTGSLAPRGGPIADLLTPSDVRRLLDAHGLAPRRAAGQNFVVDGNTVRRIVASAGVRPDDTVIEIGPGLGSLTLALVDVAARVVAVEIDAGLVAALREVVGGHSNVEVVHADAMQVSLGALVGGGPARLIANLPYNVATPLVVHALQDPAVSDLFVMVQREVGERWCAPVGHAARSGVTVKLGLVAEPQLVLTVPRTVFFPVPNVDSVMVRITRRPGAPEGARRERLFRLVDAAFSQRRKTLRNTLRAVADPAAVEAAAAAAGIDLGRRAETLEVEEVERLDAALAGP